MSEQAHHYLSQAFLSGFTDASGNIWMFDLKTGSASLTAPRVTALEKDLYAFPGRDGTTHREIETELFGLVDRPIRPIIGKLAARQQVTDRELDDLSLFVGFLRVRTPSGIDEIDQALRGIATKTHPYRSKANVEERLKEYERDAGKPLGMTADEIIEALTSERYEIAPERGHLLVAMCEAGPTLATRLRALDWTFLVAAQDRHFVVSDRPFVIVPPTGHDSSLTGVGILSRGTVKYVPLSATLCLRIGDAGTRVSYEPASGAEVRKINCWTARNAERFIFSDSEVLLRRVHKAAGLEPGVRRTEVIVRETPHPSDSTRSLLQVYTRPRIEPEPPSE